MSTHRVPLPLPAAVVDGLIGSPYFHAGFRAFADPHGARLYRLDPTPPLAAGDTVRWPLMTVREPGQPVFSPPEGRIPLRELARMNRRHTYPGLPLTVVDRQTRLLELRGPAGSHITLSVEGRGSDDDTADAGQNDGAASVVTVTASATPEFTGLVQRLVRYLEAEGRDWPRFLSCGVRPLSHDPLTDWLHERRLIAGPPWSPERETRLFDEHLLIRHPAGDGAEGLAEITDLFEVLARHTTTPAVAFGGIFETGGLGWDAYGPGSDHSVAYYVTEPGASPHPELVVVPASQICSPTAEAVRTMHVLELGVADVPRLGGLSAHRAVGVDALWPAGREWLLLTDIEWEYSLLGCDRATAEAVLAADGIDAARR